MKKIFALMLAVMLVLGLCACCGEADKCGASTPASQNNDTVSDSPR